jgi:predicted transcriptional regulator
MPAELLKKNGRPNSQKISSFIKGIEDKDLSERFGDNIIFEAVDSDTSILKLLPKVRSSKFQFLPVTTINGYLSGIITAKAIETRIADEVISAQARK